MKCALVLAVFACLGHSVASVNVGIFDNSRLLGATWNIETASQLSMFRMEWENRGAVWRQTSTLSASFLGGVRVFVTSKIGTQTLSASEKTALTNWVQAGGTLVVTGECNCYNNHPAYNSMLALFGFVIAGTVSAGYGSVEGSHRIIQGVTSPYIVQSGFFTKPDAARTLIRDRFGNACGVVLEGDPLVGLGRVFVIGDCDMFTNYWLTTEAQNLRLTQNLARWAMYPTVTLTGTVSLAQYVGAKTGAPMTMEVYRDGQLVDTVATWLEDEAGTYTVELPGPGTYDLRAKCWHWLSRFRTGVQVTGTTVLSWDFPYNGDVVEDNVIDLSDLNLVLLNFAKTGFNPGDLNGSGVVDLSDLNIPLVHFARRGE